MTEIDGYAKEHIKNMATLLCALKLIDTPEYWKIVMTFGYSSIVIT